MEGEREMDGLGRLTVLRAGAWLSLCWFLAGFMLAAMLSGDLRVSVLTGVVFACASVGLTWNFVRNHR